MKNDIKIMRSKPKVLVKILMCLILVIPIIITFFVDFSKNTILANSVLFILSAILIDTIIYLTKVLKKPIIILNEDKFMFYKRFNIGEYFYKDIALVQRCTTGNMISYVIMFKNKSSITISTMNTKKADLDEFAEYIKERSPLEK